jgi:hypothetical protein
MANVKKFKPNKIVWGGGAAAVLALIYILGFSNIAAQEYLSEAAKLPERFIPLATLNIADYDARLARLAHLATSSATSTATTTVKRLWPVKTLYPKAGAILPFKRIVAYYGNYYSRQMGVLGEYEPDTMLQMLMAEVAKWEAADPTTPVVPALEYIAVVAQAGPGRGGLYILRMPDEEIDKTLELAARIHGIVILDVQVGKSNVQAEIPALEKYLKMPNVHLALDPEFSMKGGEAPGTVIGTMDASDINYTAQYLAQLVKENDLPPKVLLVHRFTQDMVTNYQNIRPLPEVQIIMNMDGFGSKEKKKGTYTRVIYPEPVQFTGVKLFYKNDIKPPSSGIWTPAEVLSLTPAPIYVQYQ